MEGSVLVQQEAVALDVCYREREPCLLIVDLMWAELPTPKAEARHLTGGHVEVAWVLGILAVLPVHKRPDWSKTHVL